MKIVLISDIHLGVKNNSETFLNNTKDFFINQVCDVIEKTNAEYLFILGDLFDNRILVNVLVKNTAIDIFNHILKKFPNIHINILAGNHDLYYKNTTEVTSLATFKKFDPRLEVITNIKKIQLGSSKILIVPWLVEESRNYKIFNSIVKKYEESNVKEYDACFGHFHINGFEIVRGVVEQKGISQSDFEAFGSVFSGHFHIRNKIKNIQYLGCPYEITWNDYGDKKGITVFDTETKKADFFENTVSPKHMHVKLSSLQKDPTLIHNVKGNIIKFHIDENVTIDIQNNLRKTIETNALDTQIIDETTQTLDDDDIEIDDNVVQGSVLEFLNEYADKVEHPENIDKKELKLYLESLYQKVIKEKT